MPPETLVAIPENSAKDTLKPTAASTHSGVSDPLDKSILPLGPIGTKSV